MVRITWPLALLVAAVIALVARRPRLIVPILVIFAIWTIAQTIAGRRPRR